MKDGDLDQFIVLRGRESHSQRKDNKEKTIREGAGSKSYPLKETRTVLEVENTCKLH